jgi:2-polyprenyl-3-methyl-5-hydroxy-6-metoxy-1,4-benzoquinol methylase
LRRCGDCALIQTLPIPSAADLAALYGAQTYYAAASRHRERGESDAVRRLRGVERWQRPGRLLEVGSGHGEFAAAAMRAGWRVTAIEPSPALAAALRSRAGLRVIEASLEDVNPEEPFDAVVAWEVVEHSPAPASFLRTLAQHVRPGGALGISTPNLSGWLGRLLGARHPMVTPPEHIHYLEGRTVRRWAERNGWVVRRITSSSNLRTRELRRGFYRYALHRQVDSEPGVVSRSVLAPLTVASKVADRLRLGTQIECILTRTARQ